MAEAAQAQGAKKTFHLEIVTPDKQFFIGEAEALVLPALDGSLGVEAGHEPIATAVVPGELRFRQSGEWTYAVVGQGLTEIMPDRVMVLVSAAERPEDIDLKRAEAARERAEERLKQKLSVRDYYNSKAALAGAGAGVKAPGGKNKKKKNPGGQKKLPAPLFCLSSVFIETSAPACPAPPGTSRGGDTPAPPAPRSSDAGT